MSRTEDIILTATISSAIVGFTALGLTLGAITRANRWLTKRDTERSHSAVSAPVVTERSHLSAVELPEGIYEECGCVNGTPCIRCMDELLVPHECEEA